jgi:hypothetical protein
VQRLLVPAHARVGSVEELRARCGDVLAADLRTLASWDASDHGVTWIASDSTYLVVSFATDDGGSAYVQFLSDPLHRVVLWEVSSADYQPGLAAMLAREEPRLLACGFGKRASPSNYVREEAIGDDQAASRVAWETLRIVFDTLGYRGDRDLKLEMVGERIATERLVHERLRPEELAVMLRSWGYVAEVVEPAGEPPSILVSGPTGKPFVVVPEGSPDEYDRYDQYTFRMRLPRDGTSGDAVRAGAAHVRFVRAYAEGDDVVLALDVDLTGGVTEESLEATVERLVVAGASFE